MPWLQLCFEPMPVGVGGGTLTPAEEQLGGGDISLTMQLVSGWVAREGLRLAMHSHQAEALALG